MGESEKRDPTSVAAPLQEEEMGVRCSERGRLRLPALAACTLAIVAAAGIAAWLWTRTGSEPGAKKAEERGPTETVHPIATAPARPRPARPAKGGEWGRFEVPSLKMSWPLLEGTDDPTLDRSVGRIQGTAGIGEAGNIGIAGHRHTHFRRLEWIRLGDEIVLTSSEGVFHYRVNYIGLHRPTDVGVLDAAHGPAVTLVSCFPFEYVGSAPLRFIVRAVAVEETRARLWAPPREGDPAGGERIAR